MSPQPSGAPLNRLKSIWAEERTALGVIATIPSVQTIQIMARSGLDFVIIDMEHGAIDAGTAHNMIAATSWNAFGPTRSGCIQVSMACKGTAGPWCPRRLFSKHKHARGRAGCGTGCSLSPKR